MGKNLKLIVSSFLVMYGEQLCASRPPLSGAKTTEKCRKGEADNTLTQKFAACSMQESQENAHGLHIDTNFTEEEIEQPQVIECTWCNVKPYDRKAFVSKNNESPQHIVGIGEYKKTSHNVSLQVEEIE
jgi:hypothetical protein